MENGSLYVHQENGIATVQFFHPSSNALPSSLLERMVETFHRLSEDETIKVIILKSEQDKTFCAGASFDELLSISSYEQGVAFFNGFGNVINAMRTCTQPIIGRVQGKAVGGGVGLIAACDYAMATEHAAIRLSEISIAIGPFVVEPAITRKMGIAAVGEMAFNPTMWQNAYWAKEKGLFARVFENTNDLDKEIEILSNQLAQYSAEAVKELKKILWQGTENWEELMVERAKISGRLVLSEAAKKTLEKFKNKS